jgi:hypothetical protein
MISQEQRVRVYVEIADAYERRGQGQMRDRFLVLAADAALSSGQPPEADKLRRRLLIASPHHLLKPYASFAQAIEAPDFLAYVQDLRRNYPPQAAEELLATLHREDVDATQRPATAPVVDLDLPSTAPEPPIYRLRGGDDDTVRQTAALPPTLPPGTRSPFAPRTPAKSAEPRAPARPTLPRSAAPIAVTAPVPIMPRPRSIVPAPEVAGLPAGSWLAALLFGVVVTGGTLLLAYVLAQPFLPGTGP